MSRNGNDDGHGYTRLPHEEEEDGVFDVMADAPFTDDPPTVRSVGDWEIGSAEAATAHVSAVFGESRTVGDRTIIPVASVRRVYSLRGGWSSASPVAIIEIGPEGVRVRQVINEAIIPLAGMLLGAWNIYWAYRIIHAWRSRR